MEGYSVKEYGQAVKRYVQTMELKDDPKLIAEYQRRHSRSEAWPEILEGIRQVGILDMQIFSWTSIGTRQWHVWPHCRVNRSGKTTWLCSSSASQVPPATRSGRRCSVCSICMNKTLCLLMLNSEFIGTKM